MRGNIKGFREVEFTPGVNLVLADRSKSASLKDTTNALGKTTFVNIIDFCLGCNASAGKGLCVNALQGWTFTLELDLGGNEIVVTRATDDPNFIQIQGNTTGWPNFTQQDLENIYRINLAKWRVVLANSLFDIPAQDNESTYKPSARSLLSYFVRNHASAYIDPFKSFGNQPPWSTQVQNTFLLGLDWKKADKWQRLKDRLTALRALKKAITTGAIPVELGTLGELEAERTRLNVQLNRDNEALSNFRVLPQYQRIEKQANELTRQIHELGNTNFSDTRRLEMYRKTVSSEEEPADDHVEKVYEESGINFPENVVRTLHEARTFKMKLVENRRHFIKTEINSLEDAIKNRTLQIGKLEVQRSEYMKILDGKGALEEFTRLQDLQSETRRKIDELSNRIEQQRQMNTDTVEIDLETAELRQAADLDYNERRSNWSRAQQLFSEFSERLYKAPGRLSINIDKTGYKFHVEIAGEMSDGINKMKIFCYDLTLICMAQERGQGIDFLVHDSTIFDGVDPRQRAHAIELADEMAKEFDFQYILTMNTDMLPLKDFTQGFEHENLVRLRLTDTEDSGSLMGFRY